VSAARAARGAALKDVQKVLTCGIQAGDLGKGARSPRLVHVAGEQVEPTAAPG
jgi:hypothetical protein